MNVKQKILIADDSEINRALLMEILGDGYEYLEAPRQHSSICSLSRRFAASTFISDIINVMTNDRIIGIHKYIM